MNVLIIYATYSSGTLTASQVVNEALNSLGHTVTRKNASEVHLDEFNNYDLVIMGSPSWLINGKDGQPHQYYLALMEQSHGKTFKNKPFAIFGLGDETYAHFCGAVDHLEGFIKKLQGKLITDSLRIDGFYFNEEKNTDILKTWVQNLSSKLH